MKPARRSTRSAAVVRERRAIIGGLTGPCVLIFNMWGLEYSYQCAEEEPRRSGCKVRGERTESSGLEGLEKDDLILKVLNSS